ncbi:hypothetical protein BS78_02G015300 [Paspalum vaginatum]|nr:hypothetical protein BS78_02G015300 [Paspalum vaginatum]
MEMSGAIGAVPSKPLDDPAAAPWPAEREEPRRCRQTLLIGGLMTLPLLLFLVLGQESAATVWQVATAKLTAMNGRGFMNASQHRHGEADAAGATATKAHDDELLGGLLAPGMDRRSCLSRYKSSRYYKHFPYAPSPHLLRKLRAYEARHRRCAPGTPLYAKTVEQLRSGRSADDTVECNYVVWLPFDGLGNRMLSMVSGFLYALLTDRVFLAALPPASDDLFCEPFPGTTWRLPADGFPVAKLFGVGQHPEQSYSSLLNKKKITVPEDPAASNATATEAPAYVYLSLGWKLTDRIFFCGEHQLAIKKVNWLLLYSDLYFAPSLYAVAEFQDELRRLFPAKESVTHLLARYLLHPTNSVWGLVTRYYRSYLAPADRRIGVQIRLNGMYDQILACSRQEHILPETEGGDGDGDELTGGGDDNNNNSSTTTAVLIASLYADYYERLRSRYYEHAARVAVGVFQPTHEERQATDSLAHNRKALAEIYLLSFSEELLTTGVSTFGYVASSLAGVRPTTLLTPADHNVSATPCRRAVSMEPCNLTPPRGPRGVRCRGKAVDKEDLARHVRVCEDWGKGVKFFD